MGRAQRLPPDALGVFACCFFLLFFVFFFLCFFFVMFLEAMWPWEEATLNKKRLEGGWGGGRSASPPNALGVFACAVFFRQFCLLLLVIFLRDVLGSNVAVRGGNLKQLKSWRGVGGEGAAPPPQMHWVSLHVLFFFVIFCLLGSYVAVRGGNLVVSTVFFCDGRSRQSRVVEVRRRTLAVHDRGWRPENYTSVDPR